MSVAVGTAVGAEVLSVAVLLSKKLKFWTTINKKNKRKNGMMFRCHLSTVIIKQNVTFNGKYFTLKVESVE